MIQTFKIALLIFLSMILQIALLSRISIFGSRLDLPLALVVSMGLYRGSFHGEVVGFSSGLFSRHAVHRRILTQRGSFFG